MLCLLLASCIMILAAGCTPSKSVQKKVLNYLHEKYGNNYDFEYVSYTQNKKQSADTRSMSDARMTDSISESSSTLPC